MASEGFDKEKYSKWKRLIPYLYDWFANHNLTWPSLSCRWGPLLEELTYKKRQRLYLSEQTDGSEPNKLLVVTADVCKSRVAAAENLSGFQEQNKSPYIKHFKTILHPGEVNKIRECPQHPGIIVTHTDAPELYVWAIEKQPNRAGEKGKDAQVESTADLVLVGHKDNAEFALGMCNAQPLVGSGGKDQTVVIWSLADHVTSLTNSSATNGGRPSGTQNAATLKPRYTLRGHDDTIEDVCFSPGSCDELGSVGDDYALMFWDTRAGVAPVIRVEKAHGKHDLHCLDWSGKRTEYVATGCANGSVKVWDKRMLGGEQAGKSKSVFTFSRHSKPIVRVEWCPDQAGVLASGGEDKVICIWNLDNPITDPPSGLPPQLMFQHAGHRAEVVDFQWNPHDPWTLVSVSDDVTANLGGGTLQMWRVSDLIYRPQDEVLQELERFREYIITGKDRDGVPKAGLQRTQSEENTTAMKEAPAALKTKATGPTTEPQGSDRAKAESPEVAPESAAPAAPPTQPPTQHNAESSEQQQAVESDGTGVVSDVMEAEGTVDAMDDAANEEAAHRMDPEASEPMAVEQAAEDSKQQMDTDAAGTVTEEASAMESESVPAEEKRKDDIDPMD